MRNGHHGAPSDRPLPCNLDAERFVLGAMLCDPATIEVAAGKLRASDFSIEKHRRIFLGMGELHSRGEKIDRVTLANELQSRGQLQSVDGLSYLVSLDDGLPRVHNLESYVGIVKEKADLRRIISISQRIEDRACREEAAPFEILTESAERFNKLIEFATSGEKSIRSIADLPLISDLNFDSIPYLVDPVLPEGALCAFTGSPESGKSSLALALARDLARSGRTTLILDRDNPAQVYADRFRRLGVPEHAVKVWGGWCSEQAPMPDSPRVLDYIRSQDVKPLVIVDSLSSFYEGDENDAGDMRAFMNRLRRVTNLGSTAAVIHHDGKGDSSKDYRGSSDFRAALDAGFHVSNVGPDRFLDRLYLRPFKNRFGLTESIVYRYAEGAMRREEGAHAASETITANLTAILSENPGITGEAFERAATGRGIKRGQARSFLRDGVEFGEILSQKGPRHSTLYALKNNLGGLNLKFESAGGLANYGGLEQ